MLYFHQHIVFFSYFDLNFHINQYLFRLFFVPGRSIICWDKFLKFCLLSGAWRIWFHSTVYFWFILKLRNRINIPFWKRENQINNIGIFMASIVILFSFFLFNFHPFSASVWIRSSPFHSIPIHLVLFTLICFIRIVWCVCEFQSLHNLYTVREMNTFCFNASFSNLEWKQNFFILK